MKLRNIAGSLVLILGTGAVASAQGAQQQASGAVQQVTIANLGDLEQLQQILLKGVTLTDAQKESYRKLKTAQDAEMSELKKSSNGNIPQEKLSDILKKQAQERRAVLTPEQQVVYDKNLADYQSEMLKTYQEKLVNGNMMQQLMGGLKQQ